MNRKKAGRQDPVIWNRADGKAVEIIHPEAAGIDVGGSEHWVAISPERDTEPVRRFGCFTSDLREMAHWLLEKGVRSVAMQSTGVYWMPVFEILEQHGLNNMGWKCFSLTPVTRKTCRAARAIFRNASGC